MAKLVRLAGFVLLLVVLPIGFACIGFFEGVLRASVHEFSAGKFAEEYFPMIGSAGADLVGTVLLAGDPKVADGGSPEDEASALTAAFRSGQRQIRAAQIPVLIAAIDGAYVRQISEEVRNRVQENVPILREGKGKRMLDWLVDNCSDALVRAAITDRLEGKGLGSVLDLFGEMIRRLPDAAAGDGNGEFLSHQELSAFIVETTVADGLVRLVIRPFCRAQQIGAMFPLLLALVISVAVLRGPALISGAVSRFCARGRPAAGGTVDEESHTADDAVQRHRLA